jgi:exodeoxyribonuclease VII small subunit
MEEITQDNNELTYEQKVARLDKILERMDDTSTPIDKLAEDVKEGARLIRELDQKLKKVEIEILDAFKELEK